MGQNIKSILISLLWSQSGCSISCLIKQSIPFISKKEHWKLLKVATEFSISSFNEHSDICIWLMRAIIYSSGAASSKGGLYSWKIKNPIFTISGCKYKGIIKYNLWLLCISLTNYYKNPMELGNCQLEFKVITIQEAL